MSTKSFLKGATIGAILASVATIFLAPQSGAKTQKDVKKIIDTMSKKILKETKSLQLVSKDRYEEIVDKTIADYSKGKKIAQRYIDDASKILKSKWVEIKKELEKKDK